MTNKLVERANGFGREFNTEDFRVNVNRTCNISVSAALDGEQQEEVSGFKCLGLILSKAEIRSLIDTATALIPKLETI